MEKYLYKEVYIVGPDSLVSDSGELTVCEFFEDLLNHLKTKNVSINSDLRVLHGILTSAKSIPKDLKSRQPFILLEDLSSSGQGLLLDPDTDNECEELAQEIERVLTSEGIASFFFQIDQVYILYGYELSLTLSIDESDIDEDIIKDCLSIGIAARKLNKDN